ncbi:MAG: AMP-binding protein [Tannerella sp.]|jgi:long-chain acyl-CoA synthetase|nr:AMP-binding protein [Tannerella sp.]
MEKRFLALIEKSVKNHWDMPVFSDYDGDTFLYRDMAKEIEKLHLLFNEAGIRKGDKIAVIGRNSARWGICFFAVLSYGAVIVPILHDFTPDNVHNLVNHSESKILFAAQYNWKNLKPEEMPAVSTFMLIEDLSVISAPDRVKSAHANLETAFLQKYPEFSPENVAYHKEKPDELAIINYTSGTTGFSKGVMLPYRSLWSNTQYAYDKLPFIKNGDNFVAMLPMAHMYGLAFEVLNGVNKGCHIHFLPRIPSPNTVVDSFNKIRPTLIIAVPIIIEKIVRSRVFPALEKPLIKLLYKLPGTKQLIKKKIFRQLSAAFGNDFAEIVIGGASINRDVETFLKSIGFRYTVGYGMTECGPLIAYEQWDTFKQGSVGRIVDRMEVKINTPGNGKVGEILVRGMNTMLGYYKNPDATKEAFTDDGWMHTGDLGIIDDDGFLFIRGRNKTMLLGANGQNIYPEEIESILNNMPYVSESLIVSREDKDTHKHVLVALIYPAWEQARKEKHTNEELQKIMKENIAALNKRIPYYSKVSDFQIREEEFKKTPKQSIQRFLYQEEKE